MLSTEARIVPARAWLEETDATVIPLPLPEPYRCASWRFEPYVALVEDVTVLARNWVLLSAKGSLLLEHMHQTLPYLPQKCYHIESVTGDVARMRLPDGETVVEEPCALLGGAAIHYHWLVDYLPRAYAYSLIEAARSCRLLVSEQVTATQLESLARLGLGEDRLLRLGGERRYRFAQLWAASIFSDRMFLHPAALDWLRRTYVGAEPRAIPGERLYVSRSDTTKRRLLNEDAVGALLAHHGYRTVLASQLGFGQQVAAFSRAESVVAVTGSGLANIVFAPLDAAVLELHNLPKGVDFYRALCMQTGQRYQRIVGAPQPRAGISEHDADFAVDPALLAAALGRLHG